VGGLAAELWSFFIRSGSTGLVLLGILDSSFLFLPMGNDLLLLALVAKNPQRLPLYVLAAASGSLIGVCLFDLVMRKGGEKGLAMMMRPNRLERLKKKMESRAGVVLVTAALAPPPFPFSAVVGAASALQYPRSRLLGIVFAARLLRFMILALVALRFGSGVIRMMNQPAFRGFVAALATVCLVGSAISVTRWIRRARR
jgi:membrane protein YqaA with SNARE-associated domain